MKKRIWLKIDGLQLHHLASGGPDRAVWASLKLAPAFNINGIMITSQPNEAWQFTSNFGNADARIVDVPGLHEKPTKGKLFRDVIFKSVHDLCLDRAEVLHPFIKNGWPGDELTLGFFKPEDLQGKSLEIPVDFIRLQNFQLVEKTGVVTANIQIGHHLIFWHIKIYDSLLPWDPLVCGFHDAPFGEEKIQDKEIHRLINGMLITVPGIKKTVSTVTEGKIDMESKFIDKVNGCDPEATPPPIRFY